MLWTVKLPMNEDTILYQILIYYNLKKKEDLKEKFTVTEVTCWQEII